MTLTAEYLPATGAARQTLVLLHGWAGTRDIWRPLLPALRPWADLVLLDLPGLAPTGDPAAPDLETLLDAIVAAAPPRAVYLGWSLGGQLATALAVREPGRVAALVTLCSNPCFVARHDWPGMADDQLRVFRRDYSNHPERTLRRFDSLQVEGAGAPRQLLRQLRALRTHAPGPGLLAGLDWLAELDQRRSLAGLALPQLHLPGASDGFLPADLPRALDDLLAGTAGAQVRSLPGCPHPAPLVAAPQIAAALLAFLDQAGCLAASSPAPVPLSKRDVAASFSRAAPRYDSVARLQRDVGEQLLHSLDGIAPSPSTVVDLGSGTGYFAPALRTRFPAAQYLGLDLAEGMCRYARERHPAAGQWLVADAELLPLASHSVDVVFSSLAIQWCLRPAVLFSELARVLRPGGHCVFTTLGPGTLHELRAAWRAVDPHRHVNDFLALEQLQAAAEAVPGLALTARRRDYRMAYDQVRDLLDELKTLGAHNVNRDRPAGLGGRRSLRGMLRAYEGWRDGAGNIPATYEVIFGVLEKR